ncbi:MAG TPA: hypothetical protein VFS10_11385 [Pyrinomonadaceae bacterium]|nr:hypothetical protein [Pyrinomonadaceae bacterium]
MLDYEPDELSPGDAVEWRKALTDYKAGEGWALTYYFRNASGTGFDVVGVADGDAWEMSVEVPANVAAGRIDWEAWATKGAEKQRVDRGTATVVQSLRALAANAAFDGRTQAERDLEAVRAALVPTTSAGVQEYEIGGIGTNRRVRFYGKAELLELEKTLAQRVNRERRRANSKKGAPFFKNIY